MNIPNPEKVIDFVSNGGNTWNDACVKFGVSKSTIAKMLRGEWAPPPHVSRKQEAERLRGEGLTPQEIADRLGVSRNTVYEYFGEWNKRRNREYKKVCSKGIPRTSSGRQCQVCKRDTGPNYFFCPKCHHEISNKEATE